MVPVGTQHKGLLRQSNTVFTGTEDMFQQNASQPMCWKWPCCSCSRSLLCAAGASRSVSRSFVC
jgi:hypothetical protein